MHAREKKIVFFFFVFVVDWSDLGECVAYIYGNELCVEDEAEDNNKHKHCNEQGWSGERNTNN